MPEMTRTITTRWITDTPSKIERISASRCHHSTGHVRVQP